MRQYLLDENIGESLRKGLHAQYPDIVVWRIGDPAAPPIGTPDPDILLWCEANGFTLVTNNRGSMPGHLRVHLEAGRHFPGMFTLNPKNGRWRDHRGVGSRLGCVKPRRIC